MVKDLQLFIDLASSLHFANTAKRHHMSASALTRTIQRIESDASTVLLQRNNRRVLLTPDGERYLQFAQEVVSAWATFQHEVGVTADEIAGKVSVFCSVTASHELLSGVLSRLRVSRPGLDVQLHTGDQALSIERVLSGDEDLAIAAKPDDLPVSVAFMPLASTQLVFIAPKQQGDQQGVGAEWQQMRESGDIRLGELPWVVADSGVSRERVNHWFKANKIKPQIYSQVTGHEAVVSMVALGCGVGIVPELVLTSSPLFDSIELIDNQYIDKPLKQEFEIGLVCVKQRLNEPVMNAVWQAVKQ